MSLEDVSDREEQLAMVRDCEKRSDRLNDWEERFVLSLQEKLANLIPLSQKQVDTLETIWNKVTA